MSYSNVSATARKMASSESARRRFNWLEVLVIPVISCVAEAQPVALTLILISFPLTGTIYAWPLGEIAVTLFLLGLRWWAMMVYARLQRGMSKSEARPLQLLGLFLALGVMIVTHLWFLKNIGAAIVGGGLIIWFWQRGINVVQLEDREENFMTFFKIGFGLMLVELIITVLTADNPLLVATTARMFTLFFLSGLLTLSFERLSSGDNAREGNVAQTPATRKWLLALTLAWILVVGVALSLEAFSFQFIQHILVPVWNLLEWIATAILYALSWLLSGLFGNLRPFLLPSVPSVNAPPLPSQQGQSGPPHALIDARLLVLFVALGLLVLVVVFFLRRWNVRVREEDEEEVRESIPVREIVRARQEEEQRAQQAMALEPLAPDSIRAQYRDLLQTMASQQELLARQAEETPTDYRKRLDVLLKQDTAAVLRENDTSRDVETLDRLTKAYIEERYGGKHSDAAAQNVYTHMWAEQLARRLSGLVRKDT